MYSRFGGSLLVVRHTILHFKGWYSLFNFCCQAFNQNISCWRSAASSSQQIVPYNSASSARSLTVELRPSRKSFIYIKNSNGPNPSPGERRMSWLQEQLMLPQLLNNKWTRLSILWRIMEIEEGVTASTDNTLRDLHNSSYDTKAEFNNCLIIHSK